MDSRSTDRQQHGRRSALLRAGGHASPRLAGGWRPASAYSRLRAEHRHVLPSRPGRAAAGDGGFSTAELLGNAALGIAALVAIWVVLEALGVSVVAWIGAQIGVSGG